MSAAKDYARESEKIIRARAKLEKRLATDEGRMTKDALKTAREKIHQEYARGNANRVPLKNKEIRLFDGNLNSAGQSQRISTIAQRLQKHMQEVGEALKVNASSP